MGTQISGATYDRALIRIFDTMRTEHGIVVFDGICSFCSAAVRFILTHDRVGRLLFAPMQSPVGQALLARQDIDPHDVQTFLLVKGPRAYVRSDAALEIAKDLRFGRWLRPLRYVPRSLRDRVYSLIARNRYKWFGRREACFLPTEAERDRFLDDLGDLRKLEALTTSPASAESITFDRFGTPSNSS